jgi:neutral ceramidase
MPMRQLTLPLIFALSCLLLTHICNGQDAARSHTFRAGAAKVDITPAPDAALPMSGYANRIAGFTRIHDPLSVRAIVVDDGEVQAAVISVEVIGISSALWEKIVDRLSGETGIPKDNILLAAVHTHAAPAIGTYDERADGPIAERRDAYLKIMQDAVVTATSEAKSRLQPARIGYATGRANVNTNRRASNGEGGWMLGNNPDDVSDKTVVVIKIESRSGAPIAVFSNYAVHGTVLGPDNLQISADLPGAAAAFVERHYGGNVVSPWTSGAAGDQDPIYRIGRDFKNVTALGNLLGAEVVRVADQIQPTERARIRCSQRVISCPGKRTVQRPGPGRPYLEADAEPTPIRLSLLMINDIAIAGVSGEVLTNIALRLKRESPMTRTVMVTLCNGSSGYLPDDAAYDRISYEVLTSRVKRGYAESAIINGFCEMMNALLW